MTGEGSGSDDLRVSVLGSLVVSRRGEELTLGIGMRRVVFGLLAVHPNTRLHRGSIIDILWRDGPPVTAVNQVQAHVSRLRRILGPDDTACPLKSFGTSYMLHVTSGQLDLLAFHDLGHRARAARASGDLPAACGLYEKALGLWRGEPLGELDLLRGVHAVSELERQRMELVLEYSDAAFETRLHDRVLPHLRALAAREPLNEKAHARLMIALARTGQQAASLLVFDELRCRLEDELGICPGTELADAHQRVLRQDFPRVTEDTALASAAARVVDPGVGPGASGRFPMRQLPSALADFTGRTAEVAGLTSLLAPSPERIGVPVAVISGPPGVGKTALALQAAHLTRHLFPDGQLYIGLAGSTRLPRDPGDVLGELLRALGLCEAAIPESAGERAALFRSRTSGRHMLVMADDAGSADQVRPLIPGAAGCAVIVTSRSRLAGLAGAHLRCLDPLPHPDAMEMLARIAGNRRVAAEADASARLVSACGCLPLVVRIAGAMLAARPSCPVVTVAHVVAGWPVAALLGEPTASDVINLLVRESLLIPVGTDAIGEPRYRLHDLLRDFAIDQVGAEHETECDAAMASLCESPRMPLRERSEDYPRRFRCGLTSHKRRSPG
jgi:DNA-binding SARP family transcriptional activator